MTYTRHRDTQATLTVLDNLDSLELDRRSEEDEARMFGYEEQFQKGECHGHVCLVPVLQTYLF